MVKTTVRRKPSLQSWAAAVRRGTQAAAAIIQAGQQFKRARTSSGSTRSGSGSISTTKTPSTPRSWRYGGETRLTPGQSRVVVKQVGATTSKSAGFLKTKKYRKSKKQKIAAKGTEFTVERFKEESTTGQTLWIGHVTSPAEDIGKVLWRTIIKKLFLKAGVVIRNFSDLVVGSAYSVTSGDKVILRYQQVDGATVATTHVVSGSDTWEVLCDTFRLNATVSAAQSVLQNIQYISVTGAAASDGDLGSTRLDLENMYVSLFCKSTMKIQNRSKNAVSDDMDSVDNVPLYGKTYGGVGNGAIQLKRGNSAVIKQLIAPYTSGYILGDSNDAGQEEPIAQMYFQHVTRKGKVHLDPGYIKTSVLYHKQNFHVTRLNQMLGQAYSAAKVRVPLGKFNFFGIERMIDTSSLVSPAAITVGLEINNYYSMNTYSRFNYATSPVFDRKAL